MKAINWKVRLKNPVFWAQVAAAVVSPILVGLGLQWEDMTTWPALWEALRQAVLNPPPPAWGTANRPWVTPSLKSAVHR